MGCHTIPALDVLFFPFLLLASRHAASPSLPLRLLCARAGTARGSRLPGTRQRCSLTGQAHASPWSAHPALPYGMESKGCVGQRRRAAAPPSGGLWITGPVAWRNASSGTACSPRNSTAGCRGRHGQGCGQDQDHQAHRGCGDSRVHHPPAQAAAPNWVQEARAARGEGGEGVCQEDDGHGGCSPRH